MNYKDWVSRIPRGSRETSERWGELLSTRGECYSAQTKLNPTNRNHFDPSKGIQNHFVPQYIGKQLLVSHGCTVTRCCQW